MNICRFCFKFSQDMVHRLFYNTKKLNQYKMHLIAPFAFMIVLAVMPSSVLSEYTVEEYLKDLVDLTEQNTLSVL